MQGIAPGEAAPRRRRRRAAWAVTFALVALAGCRRHSDTPEEHAVKAAVIRYNEALVRAFREAHADRLTGVATDSEVARVAAVIAGLLRQDQYMEARQTEFRIEQADVRGEGADVATVETWVYEHRPLRPSSETVPRKTAKYRLSYRLKRTANEWKVDRIVEREAPG